MVAHGNVADNAVVNAIANPASQSETHFQTFRSHSDFSIIAKTTAMLETSGFYWGPMTVEMAHAKLKSEPVGTFLIRDSKQRNFFFTLSYKAASGPNSVRIRFQNSRFGLDGSRESFDCIFKLLEHYISSQKKVLVKPLRKERLQPLQELCRQKIVETFGGENLEQIPLNPVLKNYLKSFPFCL
ncbi:suppressor of cytokine signaling 1a [Latimeria chalumnae]|nr:PREDICTED: suppressor of cytokine signaling 1 [Latimeria chalumnae]|eukprot:XP_006005046.1 PREDICTED: suppressor of cytokine signaling 1 [Latimeria chalumnae]